MGWGFEADCPACGHHWEGTEATLRIGSISQPLAAAGGGAGSISDEDPMTQDLTIIVGLYAVLSFGTALAIWGWLQLRSFLTSYDSINNQCEFDEFKRVVKTNMLLALAIMALFVLTIVLAASGIYLGALGWTDLRLPLLILGPACSFAGMKLTFAESHMKAITLNDESLRVEFDRVVARWTSSAFPDW